jgi:hypothetical protein
MSQVDEVSNALPFEWLGLRQWAKMTISCAHEHAQKFQAADALLGEIADKCDALVRLCEDVERKSPLYG